MKKFSEKILPFSLVIVLLDTLIGTIEWDGNPLLGWDFFLTRIASSALGLFLITKLALWASAGFRKKHFWKGIVLGLPLIMIGVLSGIVSNIGQSGGYSFNGVPTLLLYTLCMISVGFAEEIIYRGLLLNNMLRAWGITDRGVWKSIFVSAAIFGLVHLPNMFFAPVLTVLVQAINATAGGILFSAIYVKTKNIWAVIVVHALVDWLALMMQFCFTGTSIIAAEMTLPQAALVTLAGSLPPLFFAWLYLRKKGGHEQQA